MNIFLDFIFSSLLLLALVSLYEFAMSSITFKRSFSEILISGGALGGITCIILSIPVNISEGIFVDARWILMSCSALFFNWKAVLLGGTIAAFFRYFQGGAGAVPGFFTVVISVALGMLWKYIQVRFKIKFRWFLHYLFDIVNELTMMGVIYTLIPNGKGADVVKVIAFPLLTLFPIVSTILALTLKHRLKDGYFTYEQQDNDSVTL